MSSTTFTSSSSTWTEKHHQEHQENQEIDHDQDSEPWWATYSGTEAAEIPEYFTRNSSATSCDDNGRETSPENGMTMLHMSFNKPLNLMNPNNKTIKNLTCWTAPAKVAVARRRRQEEKSVVPSQPRSWRSLQGDGEVLQES